MANTREDEMARGVWASVMRRAIDDIKNRGGVSERDRDDARSWFCSKDTTIRSFNWICWLLGHRPERVLKKLKMWRRTL